MLIREPERKSGQDESGTDIHGVSLSSVRLNERASIRKVACKWLMKNVKSAISMFVPFLWANIKKESEKAETSNLAEEPRRNRQQCFRKRKKRIHVPMFLFLAFLCAPVFSFFLSFWRSFFYQLLHRHLSKCIKRSRDSFTALKCPAIPTKAHRSRKQEQKIGLFVVCCFLLLLLPFLLPHFNRLGNIGFSRGRTEVHTLNSLSPSQILVSNQD